MQTSYQSEKNTLVISVTIWRNSVSQEVWEAAKGLRANVRAVIVGKLVQYENPYSRAKITSIHAMNIE